MVAIERRLQGICFASAAFLKPLKRCFAGITLCLDAIIAECRDAKGMDEDAVSEVKLVRRKSFAKTCILTSPSDYPSTPIDTHYNGSRTVSAALTPPTPESPPCESTNKEFSNSRRVEHVLAGTTSSAIDYVETFQFQPESRAHAPNRAQTPRD